MGAVNAIFSLFLHFSVLLAQVLKIAQLLSMKKCHKQPACLNYHRPLSDTDNFCPSCGQKNTTPRMGIFTLFQDFFSNYFSLDSKLTRSSIPFLLKPGLLTKRFNEGKRSSHVHPVRLYLIISFLFSLSLAFLVDKAVEEKKLFLFSESFKNDKNPSNRTIAGAPAGQQQSSSSFRLKIGGELEVKMLILPFLLTACSKHLLPILPPLHKVNQRKMS